MSSISNILRKNRIILRAFGIMALLIACQPQVQAQQKPPSPISVFFNPAQGLRFGAFFQSPSGGSITINPNGSRIVTGGVIEADMGYAFGAAAFDITAEPGTLISILNGPDVVLNGSNGGSMTLHVGSSYPTSPLITTATPPIQTTVQVGGTLTVGSPVANPSGFYSGSFLITFMQN